MVVFRREGGCRNDRRVEISGLAGHERQLIAELAVGRLVERIRRHAVAATVVHAHDHHLRDVTAGIRRVHRERGVVQAIIDALLVGIDPRNLVAGKVLDRHRQVGRRELLAEVRRERVEFRREVVRDHSGEVTGYVRRAEHVELRQHRHLVLERDQLAIAKMASGSGKRCVLTASGNRLLKSGTIRAVPTQGQKVSTLPVSPSWRGCAPRSMVEFSGLLGLYAAPPKPGRA